MSSTVVTLQQLHVLIRELADYCTHLERLEVLANGTAQRLAESHVLLDELSALSMTAEVDADFSTVAKDVQIKIDQAKLDLGFLQPLVQVGARSKTLGFEVPTLAVDEDGSLVLSTTHKLARDGIKLRGDIPSLLASLSKTASLLSSEYKRQLDEVHTRLDSIPSARDREFSEKKKLFALLKDESASSLDHVSVRVDALLLKHQSELAEAAARQKQQKEYKRVYDNCRKGLELARDLLSELSSDSPQHQPLSDQQENLSQTIAYSRYEDDMDRCATSRYWYESISFYTVKEIEELLAELKLLLEEQDHLKEAARHLQVAKEQARQEKITRRLPRRVRQTVLDRFLFSRRFGVHTTVVGGVVAMGGLGTATTAFCLAGGLVLTGGVIKLLMPPGSSGPDTSQPEHQESQELRDLDWTDQLVLDMDQNMAKWNAMLSAKNLASVTTLVQFITKVAKTSITAADPRTQEEFRLRSANLTEVIDAFTALRLSDESLLQVAQTNLEEQLALVTSEVQRISEVADEAALRQQEQLGHYLRDVTGSSALSITRR